MAPVLDIKSFFGVRSNASIDALNLNTDQKMIRAKAFTQDCGLVQGKRRDNMIEVQCQGTCAYMSKIFIFFEYRVKWWNGALVQLTPWDGFVCQVTIKITNDYNARVR